MSRSGGRAGSVDGVARIETIAQLRAALQAMTLLQPFEVRLAGPLAAGTADRRLPIVLHLQADHADEVRHFFDARQIPTRMLETRLRFPRAPAQPLPGIGFLAGDQEFLIWIFSEAQFRQRLRVGDESEPSRRLTLAAVTRLLAD